jgi:hypothetical protein
MDNFAELIGSLFIAVFITGIFYFALKSHGPWGSIWTFFFVVLLIIWAASLWLNPAGPVFLGVAWVPMLIIGFLVGLLFIALPKAPDSRQPFERNRRQENEIGDDPRELSGEPAPDDTAIKVSGIFWVLILALFFAVLLGYWFN